MVDHHVDRPGVDAQQCVKLTGPNRSIGSFLLLPQGKREQNPSRTAAKTANLRDDGLSSFAMRMTDGRSQAKLAIVKTKTSTPH